MTSEKIKNKLIREFLPPVSFEDYNKADYDDFYEDHLPGPGEDELVNPISLLKRVYERQRKESLNKLSKIIPEFDEKNLKILDVVLIGSTKLINNYEHTIFLCNYKNQPCAIHMSQNNLKLLSVASLERTIEEYKKSVFETEKIIDFLLS